MPNIGTLAEMISFKLDDRGTDYSGLQLAIVFFVKFLILAKLSLFNYYTHELRVCQAYSTSKRNQHDLLGIP